MEKILSDSDFLRASRHKSRTCLDLLISMRRALRLGDGVNGASLIDISKFYFNLLFMNIIAWVQIWCT